MNFWNNFAAKHPAAAKWVREGGLFVIVSNLITVKKLFLREKGTCYLCGGKCDFEDVVLRDGFLAAGSTFPAIDYIAASDRKTQSVRLAHYCCLKQKGGKHV